MAEALPESQSTVVDPNEPCGNDGKCSVEEYGEWWKQANRLYIYLQKIPEATLGRLGMSGFRNKLISMWEDEVVSPDSYEDGFVETSDVGTVRLWMREAETLIYFVASAGGSPAMPGSATPGMLHIVETSPDANFWPWIKGWDNPVTREQILQPKSKSNGMFKKILMYGGLGLGAYWVGKKFLFPDKQTI